MGAVLCVSALTAASLVESGPAEGQLVRRAHYVMGTIFEISAYGTDRAETAAAIESAFAAIRTSNEILSHYRDGNALDRLNSLAASRPVTVSQELRAVLELSLRLSAISRGAFDVTAGPLVQLWQKAAERDRIPNSEELTHTLSSVGYKQVRLLPDSKVQFSRRGMSINFGAIGKGWAVDRALDVLKARRVKNAWISAGTSTIYALGGGPEGTGWPVELRNPQDPDGDTLTTLRLKDAALSTSASYEQFNEIEGRRYSHIIHPRTGRPIDHMLSATVITPTAAEADALSTAVFVLGLAEGDALLRRLGHGGFLVGLAEGSVAAQQLSINLEGIANPPRKKERKQHAGQR